MLSKKVFASTRRRYLIHEYSDGMCGSCNRLATTQIIYDMSDSQQKATRIERYCDKHLTLLTATNGLDKTMAVKGRDKKYQKSA